MGKTGYYEKLDNAGIRKRIKEIRAKIKIDGVSVNQEKFYETIRPGYASSSAQKQMSQWENADPLPPVDVLLAIARAGDVSLEWLLCGKGDTAKTDTPRNDSSVILREDEKACRWVDIAYGLALIAPFATFRIEYSGFTNEETFTMSLPWNYGMLDCGTHPFSTLRNFLQSLTTITGNGNDPYGSDHIALSVGGLDGELTNQLAYVSDDVITFDNHWSYDGIIPAIEKDSRFRRRQRTAPVAPPFGGNGFPSNGI